MKTYTVQDVRDVFRESILADQQEQERLNRIIDQYIDEVIDGTIYLSVIRTRCIAIRLEVLENGIYDHPFSQNFTVEGEKKPYNLLSLINFITKSDILVLANILKDGFKRKGFSCAIEDRRIGKPLIGQINLIVSGWADKE